MVTAWAEVLPASAVVKRTVAATTWGEAAAWFGERGDGAGSGLCRREKD